jgi:hypothetical protein
VQEDSQALKLLNDSGFPLQIAIERAVQDSSSAHGWTVAHVEHAWSNPKNERAGFIDLVLQDRFKTTFLVVECKRIRQGSWLFMHSSGDAVDRHRMKCWVSHYSNGRMAQFGWYDVAPIEPKCAEMSFCAVLGQSANDKTTLLERIGAEVVDSTEAFAKEERDFRHESQQSIRMYASVIVTTAELKVAKFDPNGISLADGTISEATFEAVPFVRFRKQLGSKQLKMGPEEFAKDVDLSNQRQDSVFVVRADRLLEFLNIFEIPDRVFDGFAKTYA